MEAQQIVTIDPKEDLRFQNQKDGSLKAFLTINNVSQGNVAYKVKTTAPRFYVVKPNQGILDRGQKINVDITLIPAPVIIHLIINLQPQENKVDDNKFLVQVAACDLNSSETYGLLTFWDKLDKKASTSFKLKVSIAAGSPVEVGQPQGKESVLISKEQDLPAPEAKTSLKKQDAPVQQQQQQPQVQNSLPPLKQQFEKAPDDEINQSRSSVMGQSQVQNVNQDTIKKKFDELKRQYDLVQLDKQKIQNEINELKSKSVDENDKDYAWVLISKRKCRCFCHSVDALFAKNVPRQSKVSSDDLSKSLIGDSYCKKCNIPQTIDDFSTLRRNQKIYAFVNLTHSKTQGEASIKLAQAQDTSMQQPMQAQMQAQPHKVPIYSFQQSQNNQAIYSNQEDFQTQAQNLKNGLQFFMKAPSLKRADSPKKSEGTTHEATTEKFTMSVAPEDKSQIPKTGGESYSSSVRSHISHNQNYSMSKISPRNDNKLQQKQFCKIHLDKPIEYFCQQCFKTVCSKCMFHHHNGHELSQIDDALKVMLTKLTNFDQKVKEISVEHSDINQSLNQHKQEIESMKQKQQQIIDSRFLLLQAKLDERKQQVTKDVMHRYDNQIFKMNDKIRSCKEQSQDIETIQNFYKKMISKLSEDQMISQDGTQEQIDILNQVPEYDKFIYENTLKIKNFQLSQKNTKLELQGGDILGLKPVELQVTKALELIQTIQFDNSMEKKTSNYLFTIAQGQNNNNISSTIEKESPAASESDKKSLINVNQSFSFPRGKSPITSKVSTPQNNSQQIGKPMMQKIDTTHQPKRILSPPKPSTQQISQNIEKAQDSYQSKFARLKFNRQATTHSQELCLQLDTPNTQEIIETPVQKQISPKPQEEAKLIIDEEDQEELQSQKIKLLDNAIYCIGDSRFILMYDHKNLQWNQLCFNKQESDYQGTLKFMSVCQINMKKREFLMTGGCNNVTKDPSGQCFRFTIPNVRVFREVQRMKNPRYGHASLYINQLVLVMGGFNHRDDEAEAPNSLNICEKYSIKENEWTPIAPMQHERAYFSACRVKEEFVYVFGGLQNYDTTNSIEFYNIMLDKWTLLSIQMPLRLAKYGLAKLDDSQIVISGGLLADSGSTRNEGASYSCVNTVYKFDCNTLKWSKLAKLNFRRALYQTMAVKENGQIFAIGGTVEGINEVYDIRKKKWNTCQSYTGIAGQNDLQTYAICSLSKHNDE